MADRKISDLTALTTPATGDLIPIVDISEAAAADKNKSITVGELLRGAPDGTAAAPGIAFESDGGNGMFLGGTDILAFSTGGTQAVTIDASQRLGIGTSSPQKNLVVSNSGAQGIEFAADESGLSRILAYNRSTSAYVPLNVESSTIQFVTGTGTNALFIDSSQRVGIGTTSPNADLDVNGQIYLAEGNELAWHDGSGTQAGRIYASATDELRFEIGSTASRAMTIDSSGRLLVGTSSARTIEPYGTGADGQIANTYESVSDTNPGPGLALCSNSTTARMGPYLYLCRSGAASIGSNTLVSNGDNLGTISFAGADGTDVRTRGAAIYCEVDGTPGSNDMPGRLVFSTTADGASTPTERMRIGNAGRVWLLTSTGNGTQFLTTQAAGTSSVIEVAHSATTIGASATTSLRIYSNGNVVNTNNSYGSLSDAKLKENIVDASSQWDDLKAIQVRNYNFKEETGQQTHTQLGVVAQEIELVSPGLVSESPDRDAEGNDLGTTTKSVNYSVLYMKAVKALQEAMERIETLEAKVAALEAN